MSFYCGGWFNTVPKSAGDGKPSGFERARVHHLHEHLPVDSRPNDHTDISSPFGCWQNPLRPRRFESRRYPDFDAPGKLGLTGGLGSPTGFPGVTGLSANAGGFRQQRWTNGVHDYDDKPTSVASATLVKDNHTFKFGGEWSKDIWSFIRYNTPAASVSRRRKARCPYLQTTKVSSGGIGFPYASFYWGLPTMPAFAISAIRKYASPA